MTANINSIAFTGEVPWHGLGTQCEGLMTSAEAIKLGKLDWGVDVVNIRPVYPASEIVTTSAANRWRATIRADTGAMLGVVSSRYKPIQNVDAFTFFDSVVQEKLAMYEVVGALGAGETIWMLAKLPGEIRITGTDDISHKYLLLTTRHDGQSSLRMFFTPVRVVCQNTLTNALYSRESSKGIRVHHFGDLPKQVAEARKLLGLVNLRFQRLEEVYNAMSRLAIDDSWLTQYVNSLLPSQAKDGTVGTNLLMKREQIRSLVEAPENAMKPVRGTVWGAYNAATQWVDHGRSVRGVMQQPSRRMESLLFTTGAEIKNRALTLAMTMSQIDPKVLAS